MRCIKRVRQTPSHTRHFGPFNLHKRHFETLTAFCISKYENDEAGLCVCLCTRVTGRIKERAKHNDRVQREGEEDTHTHYFFF